MKQTAPNTVVIIIIIIIISGHNCNQWEFTVKITKLVKLINQKYKYLFSFFT